jgi:putative tricarboxylic transport membrane protein
VNDLVSGLQVLWDPAIALTVVIGVTVGFVVGALPGFGSANAAAIALPFTIGLPLEQALTLFVAVYAGSQYGGAIPAILVNVPGEPGAAATAIEGYPLAKQGKAQHAISVARMSSALGGLGGMVVVLAVIGPMAQLALKFGSREMFLVALLGLTMIVTVVRGDPRKAAVSALLGLLIAAMSANVVTGQSRLTFGFLQLQDGVPFIAALMGLFAFTQMFLIAGDRSLENAGAQAPPQTTAVAQVRRRSRPLRALQHLGRESLGGMSTVFRYPVTIVRSVFIGLVFGIIPGGGAAVANFLSYGLARRRSKTPELYGKGAAEGIVAAEVADNAVAGGTLIPTMILGVPGTGTAAVMLAALVLHGVQIGPDVMRTEGVAVYATLFGLLFASLMILPLGVILATPLTLITKAKPAYLVPIIIVLSLAGTYADRNSLFDVGIALAFGVLGLVMRQTGYPVIPMIMALILGPLAEENFLRSLSLGDNSPAYFFQSTVAVILTLLIVGILVGSLVGRHRRRTAKQSLLIPTARRDPDDATQTVPPEAESLDARAGGRD